MELCSSDNHYTTAPLHDKAFDVAKNLKYDEYQHGLVSIVYKCFDKKNSGSGIKSENMSGQRPTDLATRQLAEELHKPIIRKFNKRKVQSPVIGNI